MFEVHKSWEVPIPPIFGDDGTKHYKYMRLMFNDYHFVVEFTVDHGEEGGGKAGKIMLMHGVRDVLEAVGELEDLKISLFAPRYQNKDGELSINTVTEIIACTEGKHKQAAYIYKCKNGVTYIDSNLKNKEMQLKNPITVYFMKEGQAK